MVACLWTSIILFITLSGLVLFGEAVESTNVALTRNGAICKQSDYAILGSRHQTCEYAIDGDAVDSNGWFTPNAQALGAWLDIEFRRENVIDKLRLLQSKLGSERIKQMEATFQPGGERQLLDFPDYGSVKKWHEFSVPSIRADSVRLVIKSVYSQTNNGFYEIEVYGIDGRLVPLTDRPQPNEPPQPTVLVTQPGGSTASSTPTRQDGRGSATESGSGRGPVASASGWIRLELPLVIGLVIGGVMLGVIVTSLVCWFGCRRKSPSPHEQYLDRSKS